MHSSRGTVQYVKSRLALFLAQLEIKICITYRTITITTSDLGTPFKTLTALLPFTTSSPQFRAIPHFTFEVGSSSCGACRHIMK